MSGKKESYVTITTTRHNELTNAAKEAIALSKHNTALQSLIKEMNNTAHQTNADLEKARKRIEALRNELANQAAAASAESQAIRAQMQAMLNHTNERFIAMNNQFNTQLANMDAQFRNDLSSATQDMRNYVDARNQEMQNALNNAVTALQNEIGTINNRVEAIDNAVAGLIHSDTELYNAAVEYRETARIVINAISTGFRIQTLLPGRLAQVQALLNSANSEIDTCAAHPTNASVARLSARQAAEASLRLHEEAVIAEQQWQRAFMAARQAAEIAASQLQVSSSVTHPDAEDYIVDVEHWSNGALTALNNRLNVINTTLNNPGMLTIDQLEGIRDAATQIITETNEVATFAVVGCTVSQDRADNAADIADRLFNMRIESDGYYKDDFRAGHRLHLKDPVTQFEIVITQTPEARPDGTIGVRLETDILDYGSVNPAIGDGIAHAVFEAIGINGCDITTKPGFAGRVTDRREVATREEWEKQPAVIPSPNVAQPK